MNPVKIVIGFAPTIAFSLLAPWISVGLAAIAGMIVAIGVVIATRGPGSGWSRFKMLPVAQTVILALLAAVDLVAHNAGLDGMLADYGRGLVSLALAAVILVTVPFAPFTAQFARESVPAQYWKSPLFVGMNRRLSLIWGGAVLAVAVGHLAAAALNSSGQGGRAVVLVFEWGLPVIAALLAIRATTRIIADAEKGDAGATERASREARPGN